MSKNIYVEHHYYHFRAKVTFFCNFYSFVSYSVKTDQISLASFPNYRMFAMTKDFKLDVRVLLYFPNYRMFAIDIMSAKTPAAVTSGPAP